MAVPRLKAEAGSTDMSTGRGKLLKGTYGASLERLPELRTEFDIQRMCSVLGIRALLAWLQDTSS